MCYAWNEEDADVTGYCGLEKCCQEEGLRRQVFGLIMVVSGEAFAGVGYESCDEVFSLVADEKCRWVRLKGDDIMEQLCG